MSLHARRTNSSQRLLYCHVWSHGTGVAEVQQSLSRIILLLQVLNQQGREAAKVSAQNFVLKMCAQPITAQGTYCRTQNPAQVHTPC